MKQHPTKTYIPEHVVRHRPLFRILREEIRYAFKYPEVSQFIQRQGMQRLKTMKRRFSASELDCIGAEFKRWLTVIITRKPSPIPFSRQFLDIVPRLWFLTSAEYHALVLVALKQANPKRYQQVFG